MTTISEAFRKFLDEQETSLKSETFLDCEDVILLYEEFLEFSAEDFLSDEDMSLYTAKHKHDNKSYCDIFGPEHLTPSGIKEFLEDYVVESGGGKKLVGTAARVLDQFFEWSRDEGLIEEKALEANSEVLEKYKKKH
jgi:hypothetical protein